MQKLLEHKAFWLILLGVHIFLRVQSLGITFLDIDESQFAGFAHVLMDGGKPYLDSLDTKPLGIYYYYAILFYLFGRYAMWGVHLGTLIFSFVTPVFIFKSVRLFEKESVARLAALFWVVFSCCFIPKFISTSITQVMMPLLVMAFYANLKSHALLKQKAVLSASSFFWDAFSGLLVGMAFIFKYQAGIQTVHFFLLTLILLSSDKKIKNFMGRNLWFGFWFVMPFLVMSLYLQEAGVWDDFTEWSIKGSGLYIEQGLATTSFIRVFFERALGFIAATLPLWFMAFRGLLKPFKASELYVLAASWLLLSFIPVFVGGRFYGHYFLQVIPAASILAAIEWFKLSTNLKKSILGLTLTLSLFFWGLKIDHQKYLEKFPDDEIYEQQKIGEFLKPHLTQKDTLFVWGFATAIYFHANAKASSRFLWTDWQTKRALSQKAILPSTERHPSQNTAIAKLLEDFEKNKPKFFVDTSPANIHAYKNYPPEAYPEIQAYLNQHYQKWTVVEGAVIYQRQP